MDRFGVLFGRLVRESGASKGYHRMVSPSKLA
jgi:hypothetical protein